MMHHRSLRWIIMGAWLGAWPLAAQADYLSNAQRALRKGDLRAAQIELRNAVHNDPQNAEAHYLLGRVDFELGDPVAAEREAIAAQDRGHDPHLTTALLTQSLLAQNKFAELLTRLNPEGKDALLDASILVARGVAQLGLKRPDDARRSFTEAEIVAPTAAEPLLADARLAELRGDLDDAETKIERAISAEPKSAQVLLAKARLLRLRNDNPGALTVLDALLSEQPGVMQARLDRATLELMAGNTKAAHADIDVVRKAMPGHVQAIYMQAVIDAQARDYKAADAGLERISPYITHIPRAYYLQAVVKEQLGQYELAEDAARKYVGHAPNDLIGIKALARIQFARHRLDEVVDTLGTSARSGTSDGETFDLLGRAYAALGQFQDAIMAFQKAQSLAPNDVGMQARLASARMSIGDADSAMGDLEHTLQLAPKLPAISEALFFAALGTGDLEKAREALDRIHAAQGPTEVAGNLEGLFKLAQIDLPEAQAMFEALVRQYPDFAPARVNLARVDAMLGDTTAAEEQLTTLLAQRPAASAVLGSLVALYVQQKRLADAVKVLERAHRNDPAAVRITLSLGDMYIRAGTPQKAIDLTIAGTGPGGNGAGTTEMLELQATAQLALGHKQEARAVYETILKQDAHVLSARRHLVALLVDAGEFESARNVLTAGIALVPHDYQLYQDYVMVDLKATGPDAALGTADRLLAETRDFVPMYALKGDIYLAANKASDAVRAYADALREAPTSFLLVRTVGAMLRAGQAEQARTLLTDWLTKHPDDLAAIQQLSELDIAVNRLDEAANYSAIWLKQKPHDPLALNNLAWIDQQQGHIAEARALARQAYVLLPVAQTADTLGWILTTAGDAKNGVALLRQARAEGASDPRIQYHYAVALNQTGNRDEARKQLEAVVQVPADFKEKLEARKLLDDLAKHS